MAKRKFKLTEAKWKKLLQAYRVCKNVATRTRYQPVPLYGEGYPEKEIKSIELDHSQGLVDKLSVAIGPNFARSTPPMGNFGVWKIWLL